MDNKRKNGLRVPFMLFSLLLMLAVMSAIFFFSSQSVESSGAASGGFVNPLLSLFFPDFESLPTEEKAEIVHRMTLIVRKTAHLLEFAALGFSLMLHLRAVERYRRVRRPGLLAWGSGTLYAVSDEIHQIFVPGRGPQLSDIGIDSLGVLLGILFLLLCCVLIGVCRRRKTGSLI